MTGRSAGDAQRRRPVGEARDARYFLPVRLIARRPGAPDVIDPPCGTAAGRAALADRLRRRGLPPPARLEFFRETAGAVVCPSCTGVVEAVHCTPVAASVVVETAAEHRAAVSGGETGPEQRLEAVARELEEHLFAQRRAYPCIFPGQNGEAYIFLEGFLHWCRSKYGDDYEDIFQDTCRRLIEVMRSPPDDLQRRLVAFRGFMKRRA
jgi:hypothetical protein